MNTEQQIKDRINQVIKIRSLATGKTPLQVIKEMRAELAERNSKTHKEDKMSSQNDKL